MTTDRNTPPTPHTGHFRVEVGFYVEAASQDEALALVAAKVDPRAQATDYPEAWTVTPHDPEG